MLLPNFPRRISALKRNKYLMGGASDAVPALSAPRSCHGEAGAGPSGQRSDNTTGPSGLGGSVGAGAEGHLTSVGSKSPPGSHEY